MSESFGSVCSGIEAASVAWHPLGWRAAWFAEIEKFPSAVIAHHYPEVVNHGDMRNLVRLILRGEVEAPSVFTGGTPCQAFSVAGKRESLADARGNLSLTFCEIADAIDHVRTARGEQPCVIMWENVPGVLSTRDNAFGCFLGALAGSGCELQPPGGRWPNAGCVYGPKRAIAWRVLDAQYFGLAQRRKRVFVVGSARNGFDPARVLFESEGVRRDFAPRRETGQKPAGTIAASTGGSDENDAADGRLIPQLARCVTTGEAKRQDWETCTIIPATAHTLRADGFDASEDGTGRGAPLVPVAFSSKDHGADAGEIAPTLRAMGHAGSHANGGGQLAVAFHHNAQACQLPGPETDTSASASLTCSQQAAVATGMAVRRLTPRECERLQGFPDDYTRIPWRTWQEAERKGISYEGLLHQRGMTLRGPSIEECPHGPRYRALGNSWAVPCARWIGARIAEALA